MRRLLMSILVAAVPGMAMADAPPQPVLEQAEEALRAFGFDTGPTDGIWDDRSAAALAAYQRDWGLPVTRYPDSDMMRRLKREHPDTESTWFLTEEGCQIWNGAPYPRETASWSGPCPGGRAKGQGILIWRFVRGGVAVEQFYEGTLDRGQHDGEGRLSDGMGGAYDGEWQQGKMHGYGRLELRGGGVYEGDFTLGKFQGEGVLVVPNGTRYEGGWHGNLPHGQGTLVLPNRMRVSGQWINGCHRLENGEVLALMTTRESCDMAW